MPIDGFLNILKPPGMTSHDVVNFIRKIFSIKKIGHLGTLDPGAAGVLPIAVNKSTRLIEFTEQDLKGYRAEITFGIETDTYDAFGMIVKKNHIYSFDLKNIERHLKSFTGMITQKPPPASSVRFRGKRLYEYHRAGIDVEPSLRKVFIHSINIVEFMPPLFIIDVLCGPGTYIRSLCKDIGDITGYGAHLSFLVRFKSGIFELKDSLTLEELSKQKSKELLVSKLIPSSTVLKNLPLIILDDESLKLISRGMIITLENSTVLKDNETVRLETKEKELVAIGKVIVSESVVVKPIKVLMEPMTGDDRK